ncbi:MAG: Uma2 family endonuclease [Anaerolineae bacterium]|nr:Uma2 family endonuclease [Anaerolineae bacterium]
MAVQQTLYTVEEFEDILARPENRDRLLELVDGEIVEKVPAQKHGVIAGNVFGFLWNHCRMTEQGRVEQEVRHRLPGDEHNDRLPDVSYYADASKPLVERGPVPYFPDLAVEVKSPDDSWPGMRAKARYYLDNGCRMVWLLYPEKQLIFVLTADDEDVLTADDSLSGGEVVAGFSVLVREIFPA